MLDSNGNPIPPASQVQHGVMLIPAQFTLANPTTNDVMTGWDGPSSSSDHGAWTTCGLTGPDNTKISLSLPPNAQNLGLECVVDDTDGGYSASCITLQPVVIQGGNNNLDITGLKSTNFSTKSVNTNTVAVTRPARIVLRVAATKQVLLALNVIVLPNVNVTVDMFFCDDSSNAKSALPAPYPANYQSIATTVISNMNLYVNKASRVLFIPGTVAQIHSSAAFSSANGTLYFQPGGLWTAQTTIGALISASTTLDTTGPGGTDPNTHHLRIFVVKAFNGGSAGGDADGLTEGTLPYVLAEAGAGTDPIYAANFFNVLCGHEIGHAIGLATQNLNLPKNSAQYAHDTGPFPTEFSTDSWGTPNQTGLMYYQLPAQNYWIRHEDWQQANFYATQNLQ